MSLDLLDWRRRVADLYAAVRAADGGPAPWERWRSGRQELFASHPESPLRAEGRLDWFPYDPAWRLEAVIEPASGEPWSTAEGVFRRLGTAVLMTPVSTEPARLALWWLEGYAGGLFVPFRDATAGAATYGGGRYLLDTAKGADLGPTAGGLRFDFNYAYNPSCAYDPRWPCPLAPEGNRLTGEVRAGERVPR